MSHAPSAWWEDVEHLREAAERRIAERERAQREGREPVALPPLRPLSDGERATATDGTGPAAQRPPGGRPGPPRAPSRRPRGSAKVASAARRPRSGPPARARPRPRPCPPL